MGDGRGHCSGGIDARALRKAVDGANDFLQRLVEVGILLLDLLELRNVQHGRSLSIGVVSLGRIGDYSSFRQVTCISTMSPVTPAGYAAPPAISVPPGLNTFSFPVCPHVQMRLGFKQSIGQTRSLHSLNKLSILCVLGCFQDQTLGGVPARYGFS